MSVDDVLQSAIEIMTDLAIMVEDHNLAILGGIGELGGQRGDIGLPLWANCTQTLLIRSASFKSSAVGNGIGCDDGLRTEEPINTQQILRRKIGISRGKILDIGIGISTEGGLQLFLCVIEGECALIVQALQFVKGGADEDGAAHYNGLMEETMGRRHTHECTNLSSSTRFTKDSDIRGGATEMGDVVADPFEGLHYIEHTHITRVSVVGTDGREVEEPRMLRRWSTLTTTACLDAIWRYQNRSRRREATA